MELKQEGVGREGIGGRGLDPNTLYTCVNIKVINQNALECNSGWMTLIQKRQDIQERRVCTGKIDQLVKYLLP